MSRPRRWTPEKCEEIAQMIRSGKTLAEVAAHFGVSPGRMQDIRSEHNLPKFRNSGYRWDAFTLGRLRMLRNQHNYTHKQLAEYFGVSPQAIFRVLDRYGIERREYNKVSATQLEKIRVLRERGKSANQIAIFLRENPEKVKNIIQYYTKQARKGKGPWAKCHHEAGNAEEPFKQRTIQAKNHSSIVRL